jgi:transcriptional regulator with GAF, ATPase, and Fis domain
VAERVAATGEALVTVDASTDRRLDAFESVHAMRLRSILAVPLLVQGEVVGTLYVDDRFRTQAFGDDALEVAREFAEAAAIAIRNARTKAQLRRALHRAERLSRELRKRVDAQNVELEATRRALATGNEPRGRYDSLVGRGAAMSRMLLLVDKVAPTAMPVLLLGESGTGKELIARALHANSPRHGKPFVAENCGAIPETLLQRRCSRAFCSGTPRARSRAPIARARGCSKSPTEARSFSTRSARCRRRCRPSFCAFCRTAKCGPSAANAHATSTCE